ncbi:MAG: YCF48-related protein [Pseudomonadota bacterium]
MGTNNGALSGRARVASLLAWPWAVAGILLLVGATVAAWLQPPLPLDAVRGTGASSLVKPIEINPRRRSSEIVRGLRSLHMAADGLKGWAVGDGGTVIATIDGGNLWFVHSRALPQALFSLHVATDGLQGWAVGDGGTIVATTNGGKSWTAQRGATSQTLFSLHMAADGLRGWAAGYGGAIIATADGGKSWVTQPSQTSRNLFSLHMAADGLHGWAVGDGGTVIATADGGKSWAAQGSATLQSLLSVHMAADRLRGWAVGYSGTIIATTDGGKSWSVQASAISQNLFSLHMAADGLRGWAVGSGGTIIATADGGKSWAEQVSPTSHNLLCLRMASDNLHGWATGAGGTIIATADGGETWVRLARYEPAGRYTRYPALWYAVVIALSIVLLGLSWRLRPTGNSVASVADMASSDAEVRNPEDDRLDFTGLARGISRFLRNTETRPPLTLAITGDWGSGKSSLMRLVCADMRRFGHRPLWFNAWHHQKEEHLFAALLGAVRTQAVPRLLTPAGLGFRLRLLWIRSRKHFALAMLLLFAVSLLVAIGLRGEDGQGWLKDLHKLLQSMLSDSDGDLSAGDWQTLAPVAGILVGLYGLVKGIKPFGADPAVLLAGVRDRMSVKTAAAQNDFRGEFARQFDELVRALPYRLMIVIDDLDRCKASAVLDVMEAVNYLTSAGECFVLFGMATERVQAALGLAFKDIAAEMARNDDVAGNPGGSAAAQAELARRRAYAADYLQKLVNIEIQVPQRGDAAAHKLLVAQEPEAPQQRNLQQGLLALWRLWPLAVAAAVIACSWFAAQFVVQMPLKLVAAPVPSASASAPAIPITTPPPSAPKPVPSELSTLGTTTFDGDVPVVLPGDPFGWRQLVLWLSLALLPVLAVGGVVIWRQLRKVIQETRDSREFIEALEIWTGVVAARRDTPRAIKRFGNRIRYLAMLQQGEANDQTPLDLAQAQWRRWFGRTGVNDVPPSAQDALAEHQLIALGAMQEVFGADWKRVLSDPGMLDHHAAGPLIHEAIEAHIERFATVWPPGDEEQAVFARLLSGIRLPGDPEIVAPLRHPPMSSSAAEK